MKRRATAAGKGDKGEHDASVAPRVKRKEAAEKTVRPVQLTGARKAAKKATAKKAVAKATRIVRIAGRSTVRPQSFEARLERGDKALGWTIARVPLDVHDAFASMIRLRVRGTIAAARAGASPFPFRTSLFPVRGLPGEENAEQGAGSFFLLVNKAMQQAAAVRPGEVARFTLEADLEARPAELPDELAVLLDEELGLRAFYLELSESMRREIGMWINGVKGEISRMTRCQQMAERLLNTMEAESGLPPLIERAFRMRPRARAGWDKMTATQRRQELMGVFYYRAPESRQRRLDKLCDMAERRA